MMRSAYKIHLEQLYHVRCRLFPGSANAVRFASDNSYSTTLNLPQTEFPMRANAITREPELRHMIADDLYAWQSKNNTGALFVIHDGPPYANGKLHIGHFVNKTLKDFVGRYQVMRGNKLSFIPGWDCHGLPIENKVLESMTKAEKADLTPIKIRASAHAAAVAVVEDQRDNFRRWGIMADWEHPYRTLDKSYESAQLAVFKDLVSKGNIYRGLRPVWWSPSSRTALAEAELEYNDNHESRSVFLAFPLTANPELKSVLPSEIASEPLFAAVWTTTPWTIPANKAVSFNPSIQYLLVTAAGGSVNGRRLVIAKERKEFLEAKLNCSFEVLAEFEGKHLAGSVCSHPLTHAASPMLPGGHVTTTAGTGLVHTAPGHGHDDYEVCKQFQIEPFCPVGGDGRYTADVPIPGLQGMLVQTEGNEAVIKLLSESGLLLCEEKYAHRYPYDWRTKKPVIVRATQQWFCSLEGVKQVALSAIDNVIMYPPTGVQRLKAMVSLRQDWCISRQRSWGVPIPAFFDAKTGDVLLTEESVEHVRQLVAKHGTNAWWSLPTQDLLASRYLNDGHEWTRGTDTMDVWFDSGVSWRAVLEERGLPVPADIYIEGSDQHRGWFQSSLLTSVAVNDQAPYKTVLTHGFVLDAQGRKMSKSLGNVVDPVVLIEGGKNKKKDPAYGVDVLRLWTASSDTTGDISIGSNIMEVTAEYYRKLRNTARFMLGNLNGFDPSLARPLSDLHQIDRYMLHRLAEYCRTVQTAYDSYAFNRVAVAANQFANLGLSTFYFDIIKDRLYCEEKNGPKRLAAQTVLFEILQRFIQSLAPICSHLAEDVYQHMPQRTATSVFREKWLLQTPPEFENPALAKEWEMIERVRTEVNRILEIARKNQTIGASSEASVVLAADRNSPLSESLSKLHLTGELNPVFITSSTDLRDRMEDLPLTPYHARVPILDNTGKATELGIAVLTSHETFKCPRCWKHNSKQEGSLCLRCHGVLQASM